MSPSYVSPSYVSPSYVLLCRMLRGALEELVASGGVGSVECRAVAALYALVLAHPVDHRGRCLWCGWAGVVLGRRRRCRIYRVAQYWLHQSRTTLLVTDLANELGMCVVPPPDAGPRVERPGLTIADRPEQDGTEVVSLIGTDSDALCPA